MLLAPNIAPLVAEAVVTASAMACEPIALCSLPSAAASAALGAATRLLLSASILLVCAAVAVPAALAAADVTDLSLCANAAVDFVLELASSWAAWAAALGPAESVPVAAAALFGLPLPGEGCCCRRLKAAWKAGCCCLSSAFLSASVSATNRTRCKRSQC